MCFMLGSRFSRSKPPLKASRYCLESLESLSFFLNPSWDFVSCKNNYFWVKKVICHLHTKSGLSPRSRPTWGQFNPIDWLYKERHSTYFTHSLNKTDLQEKEAEKESEEAAEGRSLLGNPKLSFWAIFLSHVWSFLGSFWGWKTVFTAGSKFWSWGWSFAIGGPKF